jgi:hypothetical protein
MGKGTSLSSYKPVLDADDEQVVTKALKLLLVSALRQKEAAKLDDRLWFQIEIDRILRTAHRLKINLEV